MSDIAISAHNLSKRFVLNAQRRQSFKERFVRGKAPEGREVWALRDATFDVARGEALGLVGHNGAGKSTALKVLTGIYSPTSGSVEVNGRVSALLQLGAGFHPELTGRENVRLNGSILGLKRPEIEAAMDRIIDFSGIGEFIDSPVKIYSSGMRVRLGFSVAVLLDPEILILDEVIAVGDEQFQRKCFDHLYDLRRNGCTIVLVSHSLGNIHKICDRAVWLDHGRVMNIGSPQEITKQYLDSVNAAEMQEQRVEEEPLDDGGDLQRRGSGEVRLQRLEFVDAAGDQSDILVARQSATFRLHFSSKVAMPRLTFELQIFSETGELIAGRDSTSISDYVVPAGEGSIDFEIPDLLLNEGNFRVSTSITQHGKIIDARDLDFGFRVQSDDQHSTGYVILPGNWAVPQPTRQDLPPVSGSWSG